MINSSLLRHFRLPGRAVLPVLAFCLVLSARASATPPEVVLHTFNSYADGANPQSKLIQADDGNYYGATPYGGTNGDGTIFKITPAGKLTTLHSFTGPDGAIPASGVIQGSDGMLYGTTYQGGANGNGEVFQINTNGTIFHIVHSFSSSTDGSNPVAGVIQGSDGMLYGAAEFNSANGSGAVFQLSTDGTTFNVVHSFNYSTDGGYPVAGVIQGSDGKLYGAAESGGPSGYGTVYQLSTDGSVFNVLKSFDYSTMGGYLYGGVIQGSDGRLYGTTYEGGANGYGVVYQLSTDGTTFNVVHSFNNTDGAYPYAGLTWGSDGKLYGVTLNGGAYSNGVVFQVSTDGAVFSDLHSFNPNVEGCNPKGGMIQGSDGLLHGTTYFGPTGQPRNIGTIYTVDTAGSTFTTVYRFTNGFIDGQSPRAGLVLASDGNYYGVTTNGGLYGYGAIFKLSPSGAYTIVHHFDYSDGATPQADLIAGKNGILYGATVNGGTLGQGTIYQFSLKTNTLTTLYNLGGAAGTYPANALALKGSDLYGITPSGGEYGYGVLFQLTLPTATNGATLTLLHAFTNGADGGDPQDKLLVGKDGDLYGTTFSGGANNWGTVFQFTKNGLNTIHSFSYSDGVNPRAGLTQDANGTLYGTTSYGSTYSGGSVFSLQTNGSAFTILHIFSGADGYFPWAGLLLASDGMLYGTTIYGGASGPGAVFQLSRDGSVFNTLWSFSGASTPSLDGGYPVTDVIEGPDGNLYGTTLQYGVSPEPATAIAGCAYKLETALPIIKSFSPTKGPAGTTVTVTGANLAGATSVTINGVSQTLLSSTAATVKFTVTAGTTTGPITITLPTGTVTSASVFTVQP